jgi:uncharacterized protein YehS (DUF1456 family)
VLIFTGDVFEKLEDEDEQGWYECWNCLLMLLCINALIFKFKGVKEEKTVALDYIPLIILKLFPIKTTFLTTLTTTLTQLFQSYVK